MSFQTEILEGFTATRELFEEGEPGTCTIRYPVTRAGADASGADDYDVIPSPSPDKLELAGGGFLNDYQFSMSARVSDFETLPVGGELFSKNDRVSRILIVENTEINPIVVFHCGTPDK